MLHAPVQHMTLSFYFEIMQHGAFLIYEGEGEIKGVGVGEGEGLLPRYSRNHLTSPCIRPVLMSTFNCRNRNY